MPKRGRPASSDFLGPIAKAIMLSQGMTVADACKRANLDPSYVRRMYLIQNNKQVLNTVKWLEAIGVPSDDTVLKLLKEISGEGARQFQTPESKIVPSTVKNLYFLLNCRKFFPPDSEPCLAA